MKQLLSLVVILALMAPANAMEPLIAKLADVDAAVAHVAPRFGCYDPTDKTSCQQDREAMIADGRLSSADFPNGNRVRCFEPTPTYGICSSWIPGSLPDIFAIVNVHNGEEVTTVKAPMFDERCMQWGGPFSAEYLACVSALPLRTTP
jgi:hypothetical protein